MEKGNSSSSRRHGNKGCFKLFGVEISTNIISDEEETSRKRSTSEDLELPIKPNNDNAGDVIQSSTTHETESHDQKQQQKKKKKKKNVAVFNQWSRQEHERFLIGLREKGKGNWKDIASEFVKTRTQIQVASHAQKYFLRHGRRNRTKLRQSIFDMSLQPTHEPSGGGGDVVDEGREQLASTSGTGMPMTINTINPINFQAADNHYHQYIVVRGLNNNQQQQQPSTDGSSRILHPKFCLLPQNVVGPHYYGVMMILPAAAPPPYSDQ